MIPAAPDALAALFPEATFVARIGEGAYGEVWLARIPDGAWRAVKFVVSVPGRETAANREYRAVRLLRSLADPAASPDEPLHPALLPIGELRENPGGGAFAYAMPLADSLRPGWERDQELYRPRTLASDLLARRALPFAECLALAGALASALDFLQRHCLVHRDLKPANILFFSGRPVLADFGLLADTREAASLVGTPGYVPDEQHGRFPADIFSLGVLLTEALTGRPAAETGFAPVEEADTGHPRYARFLALLRRTTDPDPARRPQTAAAFLKELRALQTPPRRHRWLPWFFLFLIPLALLVPRFFRTPEIPPASVETPPEPKEIVPEPPAEAPPESASAIIEPPTEASSESAPTPMPTEESPPATEPEPMPAPAPPEELPHVAEPEPAAEPPAEPVPEVVAEAPEATAAILAATNRPLLYISRDQMEEGVFFQLYRDRIRVGLPVSLPDPADSALVLFADDGASVALAPLEPAGEGDVPPTFARDPVFPEEARAGRRSRTGIARLPDGAAYPEVVFYVPEADAWREWLDGHPGATFADIEGLWFETYELPRLRRDSPSAGELLERSGYWGNFP
jgi:serine/threonine protein kinase